MTKNVLQICPSCAENNQAQWKNLRNTAPLFLASCGVCTKITPCTHINFWKGIRSDQPKWSMARELVKVEDKNAKRRIVDQVKRDAAKANKTIKAKQSDLLNGKE